MKIAGAVILSALVLLGVVTALGRHQPNNEALTAIGAVLLLIVVLGIYFLPSIAAWSAHRHNAGAIFILNLLLGWTFLGWVIALVWACTKPSNSIQTSD